MSRPGLPLPLRNALATLALAALEDDDARAALRWLAAPVGPPPPRAAPRLVAVHLVDAGGHALLAVHASHRPAITVHAERALGAAGAARRTPPVPGADRATRASHHAAALWQAGLFFEVHEVLEAVWTTATGDTRQALQGVIQIAVAYHHLAHGNLRGARSLLHEGRARLASVPAAALPALDLGALVAATGPWEESLAGATPLDAPPPPLALTSAA